MKRYIKIKKYFIIFCSILSFCIFYSCENKVTTPERIVNQPGNLEVFGNNNSITVKFYGNNVEEGFNGYNIYVSTVPNLSAQSISPVKNTYGTYPTLLYGSLGCYPNTTQKSFVTIIHDSFGNTISGQATYYVTSSAHLLIGTKEYNSIMASEVSVYIKKKSQTNLYNQSISGKLDDGIIFKSSGNAVVTNIPDNYTSGQTADMFFKLDNINGSLVPVLSVESNNNGIQDVGYIDNMDDFGSIPVSGYIYNNYVVVIEKHLYILKIPSLGKYVKVYIDKIDGSYTVITSDVQLIFYYEY